MGNVNSLSNLGLFNSRRSRLVFVSLLCIILFVSFLCVFLLYYLQDTTTPSRPPHRSDIVNIAIETEQELRDAVKDAPEESEPYVIALLADIQLSGTSLVIPTDKNITLVSEKRGAEFWKLVGVNGEATITVDGFLVLDGIAVTHNTGEHGRGIQIKSYATVIMIDGAIFGNSKVDTNDGGGVLNGGKFTMLGGTITANTAILGGGVYNDNVNSIFELCGGTIAKNEATDARSGGGVFNIGEFTMTGGTIVDNTANMGGGVFNMGNFIASNGEISNNIAKASGGGVHNDGESNFDMKDTFVISGNTAGNGGGVHNWGSFYLYNGIISGNTAQSGGGVYNSDFSTIFVMYDGVVSGNTATASNTGGGGIYNEKLTTISGGVIVNNIVINGGSGGGVSNTYGGTISISNVVIEGNSANSGGGIYNYYYSTTTLSNCIIVSNTATGSSFGGGGIYNSYSSSVTMSNSEIVNNEANNGGGIFNRDLCSFYMSDSVIANNIASNSGGGIHNYGINSIFEMSSSVIANNTASGNGGGIFNYFSKSFEMSSSVIANNTASGDGGGIFNGNFFEISNSVIVNNIANGDGGGISNTGFCKMLDGSIIANNTSNDGGGIYNYDGTFEMFGGTIADNTASNNGGGIYNYRLSIFDLFDGVINNNIAGNDGGGIYNNFVSTFNMFGGAITANVAGNDGGGIHNTYWSTFETSNSAITNNMANNNGGGVYNADTDLIMYSGIISNNKAVNGGGVYVDSGTFYVDGGEISGNIATKNGGGVWVTDDKSNLDRVRVVDGVVFSNNKAATAYERDANDEPTYNRYVGKNVEWTTPFTQGYNNYDISYVGSTQHTRYAVTVQDSYAAITGAGDYFALETVTVYAGVRNGYNFVDWTVNTGGVTLGKNPTVTFTMPANDVTITANWEEIEPPESPSYTVTYNGNGHTSGSAPIDNNSPYLEETWVTVLNQGNIAKTGYSFLGWSQDPTANTPTFTAGSTFPIYNDTILYAVWTENTYTITYQPGTHGTFTPQTTSGLHYGDPTPTPPTTTGETGWTFTGWQPGPSATVTSNTTYIAQWTQTTTPTPTITPTPTLTPTPTSSVTSTPTEKPITPTPTGSPSGGDENSRQFWALVNLLLCIAGVVIAITTVLYVLLQQKQKEEKQQLQKNHQSKHENIRGKQAGKYEEEQDTEKKHKQYRLVWLAIAYIMGIVGIIVFLLTENMKLPMTMVDKWTIINAIIFIVEIIAIILTFKHKKGTTNNDDDNSARMKDV
jgi:uncharacterized repeat protein (TIGR02543 family)